ncbi:MAG: hypothetical protein EPN43_09885 [Jatrophihabitans sp.]|nr:MAG: hypothetical protein EPN43_09885 [Jatrophihabitans sp.]
MPWGRAIATTVTAAAVAGCIALAVAMSGAQGTPDAIPTTLPSISATYPHYAAPWQRAAGTAPVTVLPEGTPSAALSSSTPPAPSTPPPAPPPTRTSPAAPPAAPAPQRGGALPLGFGTGTATEVITVTAPYASSQTAVLQAWQAAPGGGWNQFGSPVTAWVGSDGMTQPTSESRSATPVGSFTLTQGFGALGNPGTPLPYTQTNGSYWWISQPGSLYNTMQSCWSNCQFNASSSLSNPNEHLYYETPFYNYAVVIDYNTPNAPGGVVQGAGSAFFLHVHPAGTGATAGCVAIDQSRLVQLMRWLNPAAHPRILIGVG